MFVKHENVVLRFLDVACIIFSFIIKSIKLAFVLLDKYIRETDFF